MLKSMREVVSRVLFSRQQIQDRVSELGTAVTADYRGKDLVLVSVLMGAVYFVTDLSQAVNLPLTLDFMAISGYGGSGGVVRILKDLDHDISNRHVLVVEDIVDTGLTLAYLLRSLSARNPQSISVCTLLDRPKLRIVEIPIRYVGFEVPEEFLVGYGLDYQGKFRNLPLIGILREDILRQDLSSTKG